MPDQQTTGVSPATPREYRNTIGLFATGVTVIALGQADDWRAMTANAVTSLSLDPLLVICCIDKQANCVDFFRLGETFSLNILYREQEHYSNYFAGIWPADASPPDFELAPWEGCLRLTGTMASLGCVLKEKHEGGDHWIMVGEVRALWRAEDLTDPLIFYKGRYRRLVKLGKTQEEEIQDTALWAFPW